MNLRRLVPFAAAALVAASAACGGDMRSVVVNNQVSVVLVNMRAAPEGPPAIDSTDPRIAKAGAAIAEVLGHPIRFEVDAALARRFGADLNERFVAAMEGTVDGLLASQKREPEAFAYAGPLLRTIAIEYGPSSVAPAPALDVKTGVLRAVRTPEMKELLYDDTVYDAFVRARDAATAAHFAGRAPESIPPAEQARYVKFLTRRSYYDDDRPAEERGLDELGRVGALLRLYDRVADPGLRGTVRERLLDETGTVRRAVESRNARLAAAGEATRVAYVGWANARAGEWSVADQQSLLRGLLERGDDAARLRRGFDTFAFARAVVAGVARKLPASRGRHYESRDDALRVYDDLVECGALYDDVMAAPDGARRFAAWAIEVGNDTFTRDLTEHLLDKTGPAPGADYLDALAAGEAQPRAVTAALRQVAEYNWRSSRSSTSDPQAFASRVVALYRARPAVRGPALFALTGIGRSAESGIAWGHLAQVLGGPLTADVFGAFLDQDVEAFRRLDLVEKALGPGWSRSGVVLPRFTRLFEPPPSRDTDYGTVVDRVDHLFCSAGTFADLTAYRDFAAKLYDAYPSETYFRRVATDKPGERCEADAPALAGAPKPARPPVLFGN